MMQKHTKITFLDFNINTRRTSVCTKKALYLITIRFYPGGGSKPPKLPSIGKNVSKPQAPLTSAAMHKKDVTSNNSNTLSEKNKPESNKTPKKQVSGANEIEKNSITEKAKKMHVNTNMKPNTNAQPSLTPSLSNKNPSSQFTPDYPLAKTPQYIPKYSINKSTPFPDIAHPAPSSIHAILPKPSNTLPANVQPQSPIPSIPSTTAHDINVTKKDISTTTTDAATTVINPEKTPPPLPITLLTKPNTNTQDIKFKEKIEKAAKELATRNMVKPDSGATQCTVKNQNNNDVTIGKPINGLKPTDTLLGYYIAVELEAQTPKKTTPYDLGLNNPADIRLYIGIPPEITEQTFIETGQQKHLHLCVETIYGDNFSIAFFTSQIIGHFFSNVQYKAFENHKENMKEFPTPSEKKQQHIVPLSHIRYIKKEDVNEVKYSKEYLDQYQNDEVINNIINNISSILPFNKNGITIQDAEKICNKFDQTVANKKKHPSTEYTIKKHEDAAKLQKAKQDAAKQQKEAAAALQKTQEDTNKNKNEIS